jgi:hypothetical protein
MTDYFGSSTASDYAQTAGGDSAKGLDAHGTNLRFRVHLRIIDNCG